MGRTELNGCFGLYSDELRIFLRRGFGRVGLDWVGFNGCVPSVLVYMWYLRRSRDNASQKTELNSR